MKVHDSAKSIIHPGQRPPNVMLQSVKPIGKSGTDYWFIVNKIKQLTSANFK
jgi:hypothetical protein